MCGKLYKWYLCHWLYIPSSLQYHHNSQWHLHSKIYPDWGCPDECHKRDNLESHTALQLNQKHTTSVMYPGCLWSLPRFSQLLTRSTGVYLLREIYRRVILWVGCWPGKPYVRRFNGCLLYWHKLLTSVSLWTGSSHILRCHCVGPFYHARRIQIVTWDRRLTHSSYELLSLWVQYKEYWPCYLTMLSDTKVYSYHHMSLLYSTRNWRCHRQLWRFSHASRRTSEFSILDRWSCISFFNYM